MATLSTATQFPLPEQALKRPRTRTRTYSLVSVASRVSQNSVFEIPRAQSTSQVPDTHDAYGSFIPVRSATSSLKDFISSYSSFTTHRPLKKRRKVTFAFEHPTTANDSDSDESPSPGSPYITRSSYASPPSPTSSSSSIRSAPNVGTDLHPILAKLERQSKFCTQVTRGVPDLAAWWVESGTYVEVAASSVKSLGFMSDYYLFAFVHLHLLRRLPAVKFRTPFTDFLGSQYHIILLS
ncbi:hypothetical protein CVT26_014977 [Gymnopilus dilepis]|uniref:Uncharacterized protein n=1 Tax=Gymnopilus dilepis TaxID=231916 RepID=A0A409YXR2_9AGAR|nr:hypothetical protein CVT26_014977 [Gymnopilus dilepis]